MNNIKEIKNDALEEKYYEIDHQSGLKILILPKEGYSTSYAMFGTKYGSIDTRFRRSDESEFTTVPEGIAHFLEHKLFESEELDAFERYAKTGASANAYTSFERTCYLFACSGNFKASLEILLDFVQNPYFTPQTVEKEQGIIGQEIRMYQDVPDWQVMFNVLRAMYENNPVRIDIAGTVESIAEITDELLYRCYNTFYNLHNMVLAIAGNVTVEDVLEVADKYLKPAEPLEIERNFPQESPEVCTDYIEEKLSVATPVFMLGFKESYETPERTLKEQLETAVLLEIIAGNTSPLYRTLFEKELINTRFGSEYFCGYGFASVLFSGESKDPKAVAEAVKDEIKRVKIDGIDEKAFERVRRKLYGQCVMQYNDVEDLANALVTSHFMGYGLFDEVDILKNMTCEDVMKRLESQLDEKYSTLSVVLPA